MSTLAGKKIKQTKKITPRCRPGRCLGALWRSTNRPFTLLSKYKQKYSRAVARLLGPDNPRFAIREESGADERMDEKLLQRCQQETASVSGT